MTRNALQERKGMWVMVRIAGLILGSILLLGGAAHGRTLGFPESGPLFLVDVPQYRITTQPSPMGGVSFDISVAG